MAVNFSDLEVMVVDDDPFSRAMLVRILHKLKIENIREANDGHQALITLREVGRVDCMFLDFEMPTLNGLEVLKSIRDGTANVDRSTMIAMLTAHNNLRLARTAIGLDVNAFLSKPASAEVIKDRLHRILTSRQDLKPSAVYASIMLPPSSRSGAAAVRTVEATAAPPRPRPAPDFDEPRVPEILLKLEAVPANARITRAVNGPDGAELLPRGAVLSKRLLIHLYDLRELDSCVAELWVERTVTTLIQYCVGTDE